MMSSRILPFAALLIAIGLVFFYIRPTYAGAIAESKAKIASYDSALAAAERFKQKEAELVVASAAISGTSLDRLNTFLPESVDNIQLILDLNGLAARSGMVLSNFDVGTEADPKAAATTASTGIESNSPVESLDISVTATGSYPSFRSFLGAIESSLRPLDVQSITVVPVAPARNGVYSYEISIRIYWLRS